MLISVYRNHVRRHIWTPLLLFILITACSGRGEGSEPSVKILSPTLRNSIVLGETLEVESRARSETGLSKVELRVNSTLVHTVDVSKSEKSFRTVQSWSPAKVGVYSVTVTAYDNREQASEPTGITIFVEAPLTATTLPAPPAPTPTTGPDPDNCTYNVTFVADVTIPDDTELAPGVEFDKIWRLHNSGTCDWDEGFQLVFVEGEQMTSLTVINAPPTPAGATADITAHLRAPQEPGTYRSQWRMRTPDGRFFGDRPFVQIVVDPTNDAIP